MKSSDVVRKPIPDPSTALPTIPKGPVNIPPNVPSAILGAYFFIVSLAFLEIRPESSSSESPNKAVIIVSLFLAAPIAPPISIPPTAPKGVSRPKPAPTTAWLAAEGKYLDTVSCTSLEINPPVR